MLALEEAFISMCQSSRVNILYYSYDTKLLHEKNFIEVVNIWSSRGLSVYGRVTVIMSRCILTKEATQGPEQKKKQVITNYLKSESSCLHALCCDVICFCPTKKNYHSSLDCIPFYVKWNQSEKPVQRKAQNV